MIQALTLAVDQGERFVILGPSGCGKTTLLRLLAGLTSPDTGQIRIDGTVVSESGKILVAPEDRNTGMVFQDLALWPHLTVDENVRFGLKARRVPRTVAQERTQSMLRLMQLERHARSRPSDLSGGEQQRLALARALVLEPRLLLMDEPLASLNPELSLHLRREIVRLHEQLGFTLFYVTHNREEAFALGTRVLVMEEGRIAHLGSMEDVQSYFAQRAKMNDTE